MLATLLLSLASATAEDLYDLQVALAEAASTGECISVLERMAELADGDPEEIARAVASGLEFRDPRVHVRVVELLGGMHREVAFEVVEAQISGELEAEEKARADAATREVDPPLAMKYSARVDRSLAMRTALVGALRQLGGERAIPALVSLLEPLQAQALADDGDAFPRLLAPLPLVPAEAARIPRFSEAADPVVLALLDHARADALEHCAQYFACLGRDLELCEKGLKQARRARPARKPKTEDHITSADWEERERARLARTVTAFEERLEETLARAARVRARIELLADEHSLPKIPRKALPARPWKGWFVRACKTLRAKPDGGD